MHEEQNSADIQYEVVYQNKALTKIFGFDNMQKNLHTPNLLFTKKLTSLHQMVTKSKEELALSDARIVNREDHVHPERSESHENNNSILLTNEMKDHTWVNISR